MEKLCVFCKHFDLDMGYPDLSDVTPGRDATIECTVGHWEMKNYQGTETYIDNILKAKECDDYEQVT